jgi:hypothetical protein
LVTPIALGQTSWDFDPLAGDDSASGLPGSPVQHWGEILRRYGTYQPLLPYGQSLAIRQLSGQPAGQDPIVFEPFMPGGGTLSFVGALTPVGPPFAAGALAPKVRAAGATPLSVAGFPAGPLPSVLVKNVTRGSSALLDTLAGAVASMCQPWTEASLNTIGLPAASFGGAVRIAEDDAWSTGDTLQCYRLCDANLKLFQSRGADSTSPSTRPVTWLQNLHVPDISGTPGASLLLLGGEANHVAVSCAFDPFVISNIYSSGIGTDGVSFQGFLNCMFPGGGQFRFKSVIGGSCNSVANLFTNFNDGSIVDGDVILHGTTNIKGRYSDLGCALIAPGGHMVVNHGAVLLIQGEWLPVPACLYGDTLGVTGPHSACSTLGQQLWVNALKCLTLQLSGQSTGAYRAGSVWNDVPLTPANLDAFGGLQNTLSGSRYSTSG